MRTLIQGGGIYTPSDTDTQYQPLVGNFDYQANQVGAYQVVPCAGKLSDLYVWTRGSPGAGKTRTFNLYKEGAATALSAVIDGDTANNWDEDTTDEISVSAGDLICIEHVPSGTPTIYETLWCVIFTASSTGESLVLGCCHSGSFGALNNGATEYSSCAIGGQRPGAVESYYRQPVPTDGKFSALYVDLTAAPDPGAADGYIFTLRVDGIDSGLAVTITGDNTTGNAASDITIAEGAIVTLKFAPSGTPAAEPQARWGLVWEPDVSGESIVLGCSYNDLHITNTEYITPTTWSISTWSTGIPSRAQPVWEATIKNLYVVIETAPGSGNSRAFTIRKRNQDGSVEDDTAITLTIADTDVDGNDIAHEDAASDYEQLALKTVPTSSPDACVASGWGYVVELPAVAAAGFGGAPADVLVKNALI